MITLNRLLARQLRTVFRRVLKINPRGPSYPVVLQASPEGLRIRSRSSDVAVEYHLPGDYPAEELLLPFAFLADCEGRKPEPVELERESNERAVAKWRDGRVPQLARYDGAEPVDFGPFPILPETLAENPPRLLAALHAASQTTDPDSSRFALGTIQFRGRSGALVATDGRQLLVQSGFRFPWEEELLVPRSTVFGSAELAQDNPVLVGKTADWVVFRTGPWTIWTAIHKEGRFPKTDDIVPQATAARSRLSIPSADARFLAESLPRLPCEETHNWPLTLDLNGQVAVRAKKDDQERPTELVLSGSSYSGEPVRIHINRQYLARALALGFRELCLYGADGPIFCQDEFRSYLWMPLEAESALKPAADAVRIVSPVVRSQPSSPKPNQERPNTMRKSSSSSRQDAPKKAAAADRQEPVESKEADDPAEQALQLHALLRQALAATAGLVQSLKRERKKTRAMRSALASLRQLQEVAP